MPSADGYKAPVERRQRLVLGRICLCHLRLALFVVLNDPLSFNHSTLASLWKRRRKDSHVDVVGCRRCPAPWMLSLFHVPSSASLFIYLLEACSAPAAAGREGRRQLVIRSIRMIYPPFLNANLVSCCVPSLLTII